MTNYDIQDKWLGEIAPKYFDMDDINLLRVGLFGYINETMATSFEDAVRLNSVLYNEIFPNKAVLPNSIYSYASLIHYNDFNAVPSIIPILLAIRKKDLLKKAVDKGTYKEFIINKNSKFIIEGNIPFLLDYSIRVVAKKIKGVDDYSLTAQYMLDYENEMSNVRNPYLKSAVFRERNEEFLMIKIIARQVERSVKKFIVYSNDIVESINYDVEFNGKLAGFNVFYKEPGNSKYKQLKKYFMDSFPIDRS